MLNRDDLPPTPEWSPDVRLAPDFTRADLRVTSSLLMPLLWSGDQA